MRVNGKSSVEAVGGWTVELDGPLLFLACRLPVGGTLMTRRQLELLVYNTVVTLPFWNDGDRRKEGVSKGKTAHFMIRNEEKGHPLFHLHKYRTQCNSHLY